MFRAWSAAASSRSSAPSLPLAVLRCLYRRLLGRVAGQLEEHVVERRAPQRDVGEIHIGVIEAPDRVGQDRRAVGADGDLNLARLLVDVRLAGAEPGERVRGG